MVKEPTQISASPSHAWVEAAKWLSHGDDLAERRDLSVLPGHRTSSPRPVMGGWRTASLQPAAPRSGCPDRPRGAGNFGQGWDNIPGPGPCDVDRDAARFPERRRARVLQMSIDHRRPGTWHCNLGREEFVLPPRRGVLVIGSGNIVHNLMKPIYGWRADGVRLGHRGRRDREGEDQGRRSRGPVRVRDARQGRPPGGSTPDHCYPLLSWLGMQTPEDRVNVFNDALAYGCVTMTSVRLGA